MTAKDIVALLAVKHSSDIFVPECKDGPTWGRDSHSRMDAWVMMKSYTKPRAIAYEVKVSRSDFLNDNKWPNYLECCNEFYFVCPSGLIDKSELPDGAGLLYVSKTGSRLFTKKKAPWRDVEIPESVYRYILFSRTRITKPYEPFMETPFKKKDWQRWLEDKKVDRFFADQLGKAIRERIEKEIFDVKEENRRLVAQIERLEEIKEELIRLGFDEKSIPYTGTVMRRVEELRRVVPRELEEAVAQAINVLETCKEEMGKLNDKAVEA